MSTTATTSASAGGGIETAKLLLQKVVRAFYGPRGAILIDQLIQKDIFPADELARRLGMQIKDVTKIAHRLLEDQIVQVHRRSEMRDNGFAKAQQRSYYYLDYSKATDVVKWRMWRIQQTIDVKLRNELDAQGYTCPLCKASYTPLDASTLFDPMRNLLACSICQTEVVNKENEEDIRGNKDRMQRLNRQTKGIVDLLKKMERVELPKFDAEAYLLVHGPALGATAAAAAEANGTGPSAAAVVKIHMAGDDDEANEKARREAELQEKRAQNALPSWIAQSTISSADPEHGNGAGGTPSSRRAGEDNDEEVISGQMSSSAAAGGATLRLGDERKPSLPHQRTAPGSDEVTAAADGDASLDAYYASLAALEEGGTPGIDSTSSGTPGVTAAAAAAAAGVESPSLLSSSATPARGASEEQLLESATVVGDSSSRLKRERDEDEEGDEQDFEGVSKRSRSSVPYSGAASEGGVGSPSLLLGDEGTSSSFAGTPDIQQPIELIAAPAAVPLTTAAGEEEADDDDDDEFDEFDEFEPAEGGNADPNQLVTVNGKEMPFSEVTDDMTGDMTADEYSAYWDVYQRVNA
ncbi:hypothetical protein C6P46_005593 [Rhodotorula mucilaginosa]|uniref:HTH TFE/IIEalpha-type domain-containing protein n=1 Tax=Rhodotorula mucilaginosa TaxID=5537 RepID=A0A9P6VYN7_RHOMI|nr:hypothetical protein C6P46_005593 [Rhodotorula mucilaginosa]TKA54352.1 hypothetical protein B0A53_03447 [Rhodotorula sp. CCFEE 5036]